MGAKKRRKYDADFKRNTVNLANDQTRTVAEVAANLGISKDLLYSWRRQLEAQVDISFPVNEKEALTEVELVRNSHIDLPISILAMADAHARIPAGAVRLSA